MVVSISIEQTEPLAGTACLASGAPVPFTGWMEMLRAISELVAACDHLDPGPASPADSSPSAATEPARTPAASDRPSHD